MFSNEISMIIYKNTNSAGFIKILAPLIIIMYLDDIVDGMLKGIDEQVSVVRYNIIDTIVSIIFLYALLPLYGINGYITVIFISELLNGFLSANKLIQKTEFKIMSFIHHTVNGTITFTYAQIADYHIVITGDKTFQAFFSAFRTNFFC